MAKILIVDDSRTSRKMIREILEAAGHEIIGEAVNGQEGVEKYKLLTPDLTTMDITMPVMDGLEALQAIRAFKADAKVLMLSAAGQRGKMLQALRGGAADFVTKPLEAEMLLECIGRLLEPQD